MNTIVRFLRIIGRFLRDTGIPFVKKLGSLLIRLGQRFATWWSATYRARGRRGKILFAAVSLLVACCILSVPIAVSGPDPTPTPLAAAPTDKAVADEIDEGEAEADPTNTAPPPTDMPEPGNTPQPTETLSPPTATATAAVAEDVPSGDRANVINVVDGDTIDVLIDGEEDTVRYIGMDTPERGAPFFEEATEANRALVEGQEVILVKDVSERDRFGRLLRYVYLLDETFVNAELVRQGYAQVATFPPDVAHQDLLLDLQEEARTAGLGLWAGVVVEAESTATVTSAPTATTAPAAATATQPPATATQAPPPPPTETPPPAPTATPQPAPANVVISFINFDGQVAQVESDEYAEITNQGSSPVNLAGWRLNADDPGQDFVFPSFDLQPGQSCRVYTNENHPEFCGFSFGSGTALWANSGECGYLYDVLGAEVSRYCY